MSFLNLIPKSNTDQGLQRDLMVLSENPFYLVIQLQK